VSKELGGLGENVLETARSFMTLLSRGQYVERAYLIFGKIDPAFPATDS
jgi:hypothetical protein